MDQGPHYTTSTLKLLEYKVGIVFQHTGIDMNSLNIRKKISNLLMGYFKTKNFWCSKGHCQWSEETTHGMGEKCCHLYTWLRFTVYNL